jgi:DNA-directed RNA polymerase subunit RPC12/RpoP
MRPGFARVVMTLIVLAVAAVSTTFVNSRYHGSFLIGIALVVAPFLFLSFALPHLLPVRCPKCRGKMRFRWRTHPSGSDDAQHYAYICDDCGERHGWEGTSSGSALD